MALFPKPEISSRLTDILHPSYMSVLVREDGWGNPLVYQASGDANFRLLSRGADGREGTTDDIVFENGRPAAP